MKSLLHISVNMSFKHPGHAVVFIKGEESLLIFLHPFIYKKGLVIVACLLEANFFGMHNSPATNRHRLFFWWALKLSEQWKEVRFQQMHNQDLRSLFSTCSATFALIVQHTWWCPCFSEVSEKQRMRQGWEPLKDTMSKSPSQVQDGD